jgi:glyoxylase-like metal-dependent hydrolase (beta-lactamase superfamily II)
MTNKIWKVLTMAALAAGSAFLGIRPVSPANAQQKGQPKGGAPAAKANVSAKAKSGEVHSLKVQGNVYMLVGPGGNTAVQIGNSGVLVVDTQYEEVAPAIIAEIRKLTDRPIRYVVNTSVDPEHTGGNALIARAGVPIVGGNLGAVAFTNPATIIAHENVLFRMSNVPEGQKVENPDALPTTTFFEGQKEVFFNEEPVLIMYQPKAHTDGDSIVFFRRSDVVVAGDIFDMTGYPHIDLEKGGSIQGVLRTLNLILDLCVPKHEQEGGTYVIPGHGRLTDEHDVLEYRDMVTIIRDRIQNMIGKKMTLAQIKAARPTYEYDPRWGKTAGDWTTDMFVEAVYRSLTAGK